MPSHSVAHIHYDVSWVSGGDASHDFEPASKEINQKPCFYSFYALLDSSGETEKTEQRENDKQQKAWARIEPLLLRQGLIIPSI